MLRAGQVQRFITGNQLDDFSVAFHQFTFGEREGTGKADVKANSFQRVNAHQADIQLFFQRAQADGHGFTVDLVRAFAQQMPVAGHLDQIVVVARDVFST